MGDEAGLDIGNAPRLEGADPHVELRPSSVLPGAVEVRYTPCESHGGEPGSITFTFQSFDSRVSYGVALDDDGCRLAIRVVPVSDSGQAELAAPGRPADSEAHDDAGRPDLVREQDGCPFGTELWPGSPGSCRKLHQARRGQDVRVPSQQVRAADPQMVHGGNCLMDWLFWVFVGGLAYLYVRLWFWARRDNP